MSEIEKAFGPDIKYLCGFWVGPHDHASTFLFGAMCATHGDLRDELFWLHSIWFIKGEL